MSGTRTDSEVGVFSIFTHFYWVGQTHQLTFEYVRREICNVLQDRPLGENIGQSDIDQLKKDLITKRMWLQ